jgi:nucleoside-triphosphatase THEP1
MKLKLSMSNISREHNIFLVSGPVQGGKTTFLTKLVIELKKEGWYVGGFLSPGSFDSGMRSGFRLQNIATGEEHALADRKERSGWFKYRRFWFNPEAFKAGRQWIHSDMQQAPSVMVIDEVGPMELEGSGWSSELDYLKGAGLPLQLWSVRDGILDQVLKRWDLPSKNQIDIKEMNWEQLLKLIRELL